MTIIIHFGIYCVVLNNFGLNTQITLILPAGIVNSCCNRKWYLPHLTSWQGTLCCIHACVKDHTSPLYRHCILYHCLCVCRTEVYHSYSTIQYVLVEMDQVYLQYCINTDYNNTYRYQVLAGLNKKSIHSWSDPLNMC